MKRLLSWLLALVMIISCLPLSALPAFAAETEIETENGDDDFVLDMDNLLPGYTAEYRLTVEWTWNDAMTEGTASVTVPANETFYFEYQGDPAYELTVDGVAHEFVAAAGRTDTNKFEITNDTDAEQTYALKLALPVGAYNNPKVIEDMSWYSDEVVQAAGDSDGFFYIYTAPADGTITLYFSAVYDDESNVVDVSNQRNIMVTNNTTYAQYDLLQDGVDNYGLELQVPVSAGDEIIINTAWVQDADGNYYPEATYSWNGNFTYPVGSQQNPTEIYVELDDAGAAEVTVTVPAGAHNYFVIYGANGTTMAVNGEGATEITMMNNTVDFDNTNGSEEATYVLSFATPVGAFMNPEVIADMDGYSDTNTSVEGTPYYYIWTAPEAGTVTLDITDGANIVVNNQNTYEQFVLAEAAYDENWNFGGWTVAENLVMEVAAGDVLKIEVAGYSSENAWDVPATEYTLTGDFEKAVTGPVEAADLKFQTIALTFQEDIGFQMILLNNVAKNYDSFYVECVHHDPVDGENTQVLEGVKMGTYAYKFTKNMLSWSMPDLLTITIYAEKDGVQYIGQSFTNSVELEALNIINSKKSSDAKTCRVLVDMLNYGAAVQTSFKHNASQLANANLGEFASYGTTETPVCSATTSIGTAGSVSVVNFAISMQSKVELQFILRNVTENCELRSYVDGNLYATVPYSAFIDRGTMKQAKLAIKAADMRTVMDIAVYDTTTNQPVSAVYTTCVEAFASSQIGGTYNDVFIAMIKYGDAVAAL